MASVNYSGQAIFRLHRWSLAKTAPAVEPVTLDQMKAHSRIDDFDDGDLIGLRIKAARRWVGSFTHRALISRTYTYKIDSFPNSTTAVIELPGGNTQSVTSIAYLDADGASQTWAASNYITDLTSQPALIGLAFDKDWPSIREWDLPITITYVAGYGDASAAVPAELQAAVKLIASELNENREESITGSPVTGVLWSASRLADAYRIHRII